MIASAGSERSSGAPSSGADWPRFHGPKGDNRSADTNLLKQWPDGGPPLVWTARGIGSGYASVTIAAGRIFTAGNREKQTIVTALDLDGNVIWQQPNGSAWTANYEGVRGTPTIDDRRVYHQNSHGDLVCLDFDDGRQLWHVNVLERFGAENIEWGLAESVLVDGPRVISTPGGPKTAMVALDKLTGQTVWQSESADGDAAGYASPTLAEHQGKRLLLTLTAKAIICVDADSGKLYWRFPHKTSYDVNVLKPIFHEGRVLVSTGYGSGARMLDIKVSPDGVEAEEAWTNKELDNHHGGLVLVDGFVYGSSHRGKWMCVDWATGERRYSDAGIGKGSLTWADGMLYCLSEKSTVGLVACTPDAHDVVSRFKLPEGGEGPSWAHPVVVGGRLYIRYDDYLYCYDVAQR